MNAFSHHPGYFQLPDQMCITVEGKYCSAIAACKRFISRKAAKKRKSAKSEFHLLRKPWRLIFFFCAFA
jgi:hypothetical protein